MAVSERARCECGELHVGGSLDFNSYGVAACSSCGWTGVPLLEEGGRASSYCPACEPVVSQREIVAALAPRQSRNAPCACSSGRKYKKCCGAVA